jgi:hypothetical protein
MNAETVDHATLAHLADAGALHGARAVGQAGGWALMVRFGAGERVLAAQRSRRARVFKRMETLVSYLKGVGVSSFDVDSAGYSPETSASRARPDRAEALRNAHQASAHDAWFKAQVQIALNEADVPEAQWISNEAASDSWAKKRGELAARVAAGAVD